MPPGPEELAGSLQRFGLGATGCELHSPSSGIGETDLDALEYLEAEGNLTQRELGERLSLTSGAVTMLVDRLEHAGWVNRRAHETDRRYTVLELSPRARSDAR